MINNQGSIALMVTFIFILYYTVEYIKKAYEPWLKEHNLHLEQIFIFVSFFTFVWFTYLYTQDDSTTQNIILGRWLTTVTSIVTPAVIFFVIIFLFAALSFLFPKEKGGEHFDK